VSGANIFRSNEQRLLHSIAQSFECIGDRPEVVDEWRYVFQEYNSRRNLVNHAKERWPDGPLVGVTPALSSHAVGLTWQSGNDRIHLSTPLAAVEGSNVGPDRPLIQAAFRHASRQYRAGIGFPLHVADCASRWHCDSDGEVEPSTTGADGQHVEGIEIHIHYLTLQHPGGRVKRFQHTKKEIGVRAALNLQGESPPLDNYSRACACPRAFHLAA
jgi:hypothetical protein